jgi:hypothetical protein
MISYERYIILKDNRFFAGFNEGEPSRNGEPMSYEVFKKEFNACVLFWENRNVEPVRFTYQINLIFKMPKLRLI